jgi:hypothetical protein
MTMTTTVLHVSASFHKAIIGNYSVIGGGGEVTVKLMKLRLRATHYTFVPDFFILFKKKGYKN